MAGRRAAGEVLAIRQQRAEHRQNVAVQAVDPVGEAFPHGVQRKRSARALEPHGTGTGMCRTTWTARRRACLRAPAACAAAWILLGAFGPEAQPRLGAGHSKPAGLTDDHGLHRTTVRRHAPPTGTGWRAQRRNHPVPHSVRDRQVHPVPRRRELTRLLGHPLLDLRAAAAVLAADVLGDLHRAELRPAHRAEVRRLRRLPPGASRRGTHAPCPDRGPG